MKCETLKPDYRNILLAAIEHGHVNWKTVLYDTIYSLDPHDLEYLSKKCMWFQEDWEQYQ